MSKISPNDPAMPTLFYNEITGQANGHSAGLTIRQEFAVRAMQGIISSGVNHYSAGGVAKVAVEFADALINELNKSEQ